jgi:TolB protein
MRRWIQILCVSVFSSVAWSQAKVVIDVGEAKVRRTLLALPDFNYLGAEKSSSNLQKVRELFNVVRNDLDSTGQFTFIKPEAFLEDTTTLGLRPSPGEPQGFDIKKWQSIGTEFLVRGGAQVAGGDIVLEIYVYQVSDGKVMLGKRFSGPTAGLRKVAHTFSNEFMKSVTGKEGFFNHRIVASIDSGPQTHREIYTMDWDGANSKQITTHKSIAISPSWSSDGKHIAYTTFVSRKVGKGPMKKNPDLFMFEVQTGRRWLVSYREGLNSGAAFFPSSNDLLVTLSSGGVADIFKMSLDGKKTMPITKGPGRAMNVEPAVSPDGKRIAFSSDRSGVPMIFVMNIDGSAPKRITFAGHYNSTPSWSPDGKSLAFAGFDKSKDNFDVFMVNVDTTQLVRLTSAKKASGRFANNEEPIFSPDGRQVFFISDRDGQRQLYLVNTDGSNERRVTFDKKYYSKPKWGPPSDN